MKICVHVCDSSVKAERRISKAQEAFVTNQSVSRVIQGQQINQVFDYCCIDDVHSSYATETVNMFSVVSAKLLCDSYTIF